METQIEYAIDKLTPSYKRGLVLYVWTLMFLVSGIVHISFFVIGVVLLIFVLLYVLKWFGEKKKMTFIKQNYKTDIDSVMEIIIEKIEDCRRGISNDSFVAPTVGRDLGEAKSTNKANENLLRLWMLLKENIITYHRINPSK